MATMYGRINHSETTFGETTFHKNQTLTSASNGVSLIHIRSGSVKVPGTVDSPPTISGSHWNFIHNQFYKSGSSFIHSAETEKFNQIYHSYNQHSDLKPFYKNKFYTSGSVVYIPQQYFGERIQPGSFKLTARTGSHTNTTKEIVVVDDGNGNLYAPSASYVGFQTGSISSSTNYVGNVYYDLGVAVLTETASWSGSQTALEQGGITFQDIGDGRFGANHTGSAGGGEQNYKFWDVKFNSSTPIFTSQYSIKIPASAFNVSMNATVRRPVSGSIPSGSSTAYWANVRNELTGSQWSPYFNQVQLFRNRVGEEPLLVANLPRPIQKRDDIDLIIKFRIDH
jgi:hypothetical protein